MWRDRYNYFNVQFDKQFSQKVEKNKVVEIILATGCFKQKDHQSFGNAAHFLWMEIIVTETTNGNFTSSEEGISFVNLIAIVCSKGENMALYDL